MVTSTKVLVILSSAEKEKAIAGLMYAKSAHENRWVDDIRVVLFGPIERILANDEELKELSSTVFKITAHPVACTTFADEPATADALKALGCEVDQVGGIISEYLRNGFIPLVF
jgi:hypothetical protein